MCVYPIRMKTGTIYVNISVYEESGLVTKGGAETALENNNVFGIEPKIYFEGTDPSDPLNETVSDLKSPNLNAVTLVASFVSIGLIATGGSAVFIYYENLTALAIFWVVMFSIVANYIYNNVIKDSDSL